MLKTDSVADVRDAQRTFPEQDAGFVQTILLEILAGTDVEISLEQFKNIGAVDVRRICDIGNGYIIKVVLVYEVDSSVKIRLSRSEGVFFSVADIVLKIVEKLQGGPQGFQLMPSLHAVVNLFEQSVQLGIQLVMEQIIFCGKSAS